MKLKYCRSDLKPSKALLEAVKVPDPLTVEQFVSKDPDLVWADHLFLAAYRVPRYNGHGVYSQVRKSRTSPMQGLLLTSEIRGGPNC